MLTLTELVHQCTQETERYFQGQINDPHYCFELFRRAIVEHDQAAWEAIHAQYQALVAGWVKRHRSFETSGEEVQYFVNRAFEKIWVALTPNRFGHFLDLGALLRYLKMCVHSVITDYNRSHDQADVFDPTGESGAEKSEPGPTVEDQGLDEADRRKFWDWIGARLHNENERRVVYGSFVLSLKPREIYAQFPEMFHDVGEVYRIKQNVLARLRRDPDFNQFVGEDD